MKNEWTNEWTNESFSSIECTVFTVLFMFNDTINNVQCSISTTSVRCTCNNNFKESLPKRTTVHNRLIILHTFVGSFVQSILYYLQFRMNSFVDTSSIVPTIPLSDDIRIFLWFIKKQADIRTLPQPVKCIWPFVVSKRWVIWINLWVKATRDWSSMSDLRIFEQCTFNMDYVDKFVSFVVDLERLGRVSYRFVHGT